MKLFFLIKFDKKCEIFFKGLANSSDLPYVTKAEDKCLLNCDQL